VLELIARSRELSHENRRLLTETNIRIALGRRVCTGWTGIRGGADLRTPPDADNTHWPLDELQRLVRDKLRRGALFLLRNERYWAGPANGRMCRVCSQPISKGNECEIPGPRGYVHAHMVCHRLWLRESETIRAEREENRE